MAIRNFSLGPARGLVSAQAEDLGNLVVIAGPNGAGKSTLLDLIRGQRNMIAEPGTDVLFIGPHRTWRPTTLNRMTVYGYPLDTFSALLGQDTMPGFNSVGPNGLHMVQNQPRNSTGTDEAQAFVKISLIKLLDRQRSLVTRSWTEQGGAIAPGTVPDLFEPWRRLVDYLLPHLVWDSVDDTNDQEIGAYFITDSGSGARIDLDQLSSGEKASLAMLLPFVERQAEYMVSGSPAPEGIVPVTMLIDEPEIHLHPLLQLQVLSYLRDLAAEGAAQFIVTTHSPSILDALRDDELWLLSPASISPSNQLARLSTGYERLETAREITGHTHLLTRSKPVVFIEGESPRNGRTSDSQLVRMLLPEVQAWALVPTGGKKEVRAAISRLEAAELDLPGFPVFGLVDQDHDDVADDGRLIGWGVAMIENLLLDPAAIAAAVGPMFATGQRPTEQLVSEALDRAVADRRHEEIALRVRTQLPSEMIRVSGGGDGDLRSEATRLFEAWAARLDDIDLDELRTQARLAVESIENDGAQREKFHGKSLLRSVYDELGVTRVGFSTYAFALQVASHAAGSERVRRLTLPALDRIRFYYPAALVEILAPGPDGIGAQAETYHQQWLSGSANSDGREEHRRAVFAYARTLAGEGQERAMQLASQIGVGH